MVANTGQIQLNQSFGSWISKQAADERFQRQVEIGTWNGRGSTCCFADGFAKRTDSPSLQSYEIHPMLAEEAAELWSFQPQIHVIHGRILTECPEQERVKSLFPSLTEAWHAVDVRNFHSCPQVPMEDPQVVLLDGAEYLTWFEFVEQIQNCPSIQVIMLDDSNRHRAQKTWMIQDALLNSPDWKRVAQSENDRNGWDIFERV